MLAGINEGEHEMGKFVRKIVFYAITSFGFAIIDNASYEADLKCYDIMEIYHIPSFSHHRFPYEKLQDYCVWKRDGSIDYYGIRYN